VNYLLQEVEYSHDPPATELRSWRCAGYRSFQYLEPGADYTEFKLAREIDRVPSRTIEVSSEQAARAQRLLDESLVISLHDHAFVVPEDPSQIFEYRRSRRDWTGYEGLSVSGIDAIFDCLMDGTACITSKAGWKWVDGIENPAEEFPNIVRWLVKHNYSDDDIRRVLGENIMRVLKQVWSR
jgi:hypothetical protein